MSLYDRITELQGAIPWGSVLDAGSGPASMRWLLSLPADRWTAITASARMAANVQVVIGGRERAQDRVVVGNWLDPELLEGERYDTVLADYLLGAIDGFAPYWQDQLFPRLRPLVGTRLYVVGVEPYIPYIPESAAGRMVCDIGRLRDACLLLAGDRPYREYPLEWVLRQLTLSGFRIVNVQRVPIRYGERFINSQLDLCSEAAGKIANRELAVSLHSHIAQLRNRALMLMEREQGLRHGHDYIVVAQPC